MAGRFCPSLAIRSISDSPSAGAADADGAADAAAGAGVEAGGAGAALADAGGAASAEEDLLHPRGATAISARAMHGPTTWFRLGIGPYTPGRRTRSHFSTLARPRAFLSHGRACST